MVCEKSGELMMRYMDGLLDDFDEMNLMKHIETCETCRADFAVYTEILQGFNLDSMEITEAPEDFAANVMSQIADINIYFPEKVRTKGVLIDNILIALWGVLAAVFAAGLLMFLFHGQFFAWLDGQGLHGLSAALLPFAGFVTSFGAAAADFAQAAINLIVDGLTEFWPALSVAVAGMTALGFLALYLSPKSVKNRVKN